MSYETMRRSSRIPKELAILVTGSDLEGKGFSEMTKTVLLSRHGAGLVSTFKLYPEQEIIIRYLDTNKEAIGRVVGQIGGEGNVYTYGVAFVDQNVVDFWGIDFAPATEKEKEARRVLLECATCGRCETVQQTDVESDVFIVNSGIVRYCKSCRDSTLWKRSNAAPEEETALVAVTREARPSSFSGLAMDDESPAPAPTAQIPVAAASAPVASNAASSFAAGNLSASSAPISSFVEEAPERDAAEPTPASPARVDPPTTQKNKRKHTRMKVTYKACVRSGVNDDVVSCENMSRGGICFKSRRKYLEGTEIKVAVPYAPGDNAIFVPATIAWVVEIEKDKQYKCGVAYRITSRAS